jgi:hypothetical protein
MRNIDKKLFCNENHFTNDGKFHKKGKNHTRGAVSGYAYAYLKQWTSHFHTLQIQTPFMCIAWLECTLTELVRSTTVHGKSLEIIMDEAKIAPSLHGTKGRCVEGVVVAKGLQPLREDTCV